MRLGPTTSRWIKLAAAALIVGTGVYALGYSEDVPESRLGSDWRCTRTAFFVTSCTPAGVMRTQQRPPVIAENSPDAS